MLIYQFLFFLCCCHFEVEGAKSVRSHVSSALVKLNVGGKEYETTVETLTRINNTFFTDLLSKPQELQVDDKGRIFIDRNGDLFSYVLNYLRTGEFYLLPDHHQRLALKYEAKFYQLNDLQIPAFFNGGNLLDLSQELKLNEFYGVLDQQWKLLFKATVHGFSASTLHSLCDNKGPTMTIIKSTGGFLFGGFTKESWAGNEFYKSDAAAFLFTLTNPHDIAATKFFIRSDKIHKAIFVYPPYGPTFGEWVYNGYDIHISDNSNTNTLSYTNIGHTYTDTTGKGDKLFAGSRNFQVSDIEVFGLTSQ